MDAALPPDLQQLQGELDAAERDAYALMDGLSNDVGAWRENPASWSVAECLDHLATANRIYVAAMEPSAARARSSDSRRRGPAKPGVVGGWFVTYLEPPVNVKGKAPRKIRPRSAPPLDDAFASFLASQNEVRGFIQTYAEIDLARVRFPNPFIRGVRFSVATGLHVIAAHERRHLWQAWRVRRAAERSAEAL